MCCMTISLGPGYYKTDYACLMQCYTSGNIEEHNALDLILEPLGDFLPLDLEGEAHM